MATVTSAAKLEGVSSIVVYHALPLLLETFLYALYIVLTVYFIYQRWIDRKTSPFSTSVLLVTLAMFTFFSLYWAVDVYLLWATTYDHANMMVLYSLHGIATPWPVPLVAQQVSQYSVIVLGDIVSLWRAYAIFGRQWWLLLLSLGIAIAENGKYLRLCLLSTSFVVAANILTGCSQLLSTLLIAYKAWVHWRDIREFAHHNQIQHSIALLLVMIESGVVYLALLLWYGAINLFGRHGSLVSTTVFFYMTPLIAMYPTLVVVLVTSRRSVLERGIASGGQPSNLHIPSLHSVHIIEPDPAPGVETGLVNYGARQQMAQQSEENFAYSVRPLAPSPSSGKNNEQSLRRFSESELPE
ncbi:hypothetical protein PENSPDRAFT_754004 [Peniophora sp. CONT]|nr:hypothetical protein PENSPDRAFT_754004 [Peniophora sp. CONT]